MKTVSKVRAYAKSVPQAPRKVNIVAGLVRGRSVADALVILEHTPRRAALPLAKVIESARANAVNNHGFDGKTLTIKTLSVTAANRMRRYKPTSHGRALPFEKISSNILVEVTGDLKPKKVAKPVAAKTDDKPKTTKKEEVK